MSRPQSLPLPLLSASSSPSPSVTRSPTPSPSPSPRRSLLDPDLDAHLDLGLPPAYDEPPASLPAYTPRGACPLPRRAQNIRSALRLLRLPPGQHKPAALARHLALFEKLVSRLEAEGVPLSPLERGWALVTSCPGLPLLDVWYDICAGTPEVGEEAWAALLAAYAGAEVRLSKAPHAERTRSTWRALLGR
ncbi:hypothetical protein CC85DRAFT_289147 [Cutaneotrichosporon oleaginosum]|uniref:Uncharacterized protein n=1 Tax=Cutaneotrichosporon oleaginosum TaxID=879819 RepID=A0A0J0XCL1_9TREE|nr:uncharacterized protein CC85DRAFT_289147 [Cutaneotrichosporon oleaginosum]KLT38818.1 hypothetical protein CC85DRAFT_289147 [Cutaneotrichosporon oleaginosum]TXT04737.1 hypothetical protein COLE_07556 [Cutaneotrichosporon oleaginosum]